MTNVMNLKNLASLTSLKKKIADLRKRKHLGYTLDQTTVVLVIMSILITFGLVKFGDYIHAANITKMKADMKSIATAATTYQFWSTTNEVPESIDAILQGLTEAESNDGQAHDSFLKANDTENGKFLDPWGREYEYDAATRTISCTPKSLLGTELDKYEYEF